MVIRMSKEILNVLETVYHYKQYRRGLAELQPEMKINWYEDTRKFYFGLELPEGLNKNEFDFEYVTKFRPDIEPYRTWMNTNEDELKNYNWKNF